MKELVQAEHYVEISICFLAGGAEVPLTVVSIVVYQLLKSAGVFHL
jgi:hypothetical protein